MMMIILISMVATKMIVNFNSKLMALILMELMFLLTILSQFYYKSSNFVTTMLLYLMVFMVLDSTMGMAILMSSSRNSYLNMQQFSSI